MLKCNSVPVETPCLLTIMRLSDSTHPQIVSLKTKCQIETAAYVDNEYLYFRLHYTFLDFLKWKCCTFTPLQLFGKAIVTFYIENLH